MDPHQGPQQPDLLIGQTIGNYLVTQKLGEGGMGAVYLAEHPSIGKKVALKVLHSEFSTNQEVTARFFHEAKAVNDIGHPNIVDIVDFGILQAGGGREQLVYFIMEYLAGVTLSQLIRNEAPLPPERALSIALQVADALSASHKCGIVHRDLKPDNIILLQRGRERDFVKLLDFGIAKLTGGSAMGSHRTRTGIVMGTPAYMSPEQCEGRDTVDKRTDVYALGIVIYEMLTGRVPFVGDGYGEILVQHLTQRPVPPSQFRMLPAHVEVVVLKALEKRADLRYPTMEEFMRGMSDPVGYVESHGGVNGFLQRQLVPSSAPLPSVRLTPAPLTPLPGTLIAPNVPGVAQSMSGARGNAPSVPGVAPSMSGRGNAPSVPGMPGVVAATPAPTTLGSATGQIQASRGKAGYILAGLVIAATAVAAIIVVAGKEDKVVVPGGSGSEGSALVASGSESGTTGTGAAGTGTTAGTTGTGATGTGTTGTGTTGTGATGTGTTGTGATGTGTTGTGTTGTGATGTGTTGTGATGTGATGTGTTGTGATGTGTTGTGATGTGTTGTGAAGTGTTAGTTGTGTTAGATGTGATGTGTTAGTTGTGATGTGTTAGTTTGTGATGTGTTGTGATGTGTTAGATGTGATGTRTGTTGSSTGGTTTLPEETEIGVSSSPSGARIYVDNVDTGKITPAKLNVPRKRAKSISITLRLKGYEQFTFKSVDVSEASQQKAELVKVKTVSHPSSRCRTAERPGCKRDYDDCCLPEASGSGRPGPGTKQGSGAGSAAGDRDDLMRP